MTAATADPSDEFFHTVGDHPSWSESYYFNVIDANSGIGAFTRMGFRPNDGWADALHAVYLPGGRVAFTYGRRTDLSPAIVDAFGDADPSVGNLTLRRGEPFTDWGIVYSGDAQDLADPTVMLAATRDRPAGWNRPARLEMDVTFEAITAPHYAVGGSQGHFEQTGSARGTIRLGNERWEIDGFGVRDKSWGPRTWQAPSGSAAKADGPAEVESGCFLNWFSMNFGPDLALGGACGRTADGTFVGKGWIQRGERTIDLNDVTIVTDFDPSNPLLHRAVHLRGVDAEGTPVAVEGTVVTICPTKIPRRDGVTFVNEGLARFETEGRTGWGIAEHWHAVPR
ncbi:MAG: hypothetical protein ACK5OX_01735 [Desertimonas sp.]